MFAASAERGVLFYPRRGNQTVWGRRGGAP